MTSAVILKNFISKTTLVTFSLSAKISNANHSFCLQVCCQENRLPISILLLASYPGLSAPCAAWPTLFVRAFRPAFSLLIRRKPVIGEVLTIPLLRWWPASALLIYLFHLGMTCPCFFNLTNRQDLHHYQALAWSGVHLGYSDLTTVARSPYRYLP